MTKEPQLAHPPHPQAQGGMAMVMALFFTIIATGLVMSGIVMMSATEKKTEVGFRMNGQARQFARAGLIDTLAWFRRQSTQPVSNFTPVRDLLVNPPVIDTDDPTIGIVREFEINGSLWGRYEIRRTEVRDVSAERKMVGIGIVWYLRSWGYVFRRHDSTMPYNQEPNRVLAVNSLETEIRRMTLAAPGAAALCSENGGATVIGNKGSLAGLSTGAGLFYKAGTGSPSFLSGSTVTGSPNASSSSIYDSTCQAVFGVSEQELRSLSDDRITTNAAFPSPVPKNYLLFVDTNVTFDITRPLRGSGIVYVNGDLTVNSGSNSFFSGFLYVKGNLILHAPASISGTVVVRGSVDVSGVGDKAEIYFDDGTLSALRTEVGQYRLFGAFRDHKD
jgi:hypothetical protein